MIDPEPSYVEALHENQDDDGFGPTYRSSTKNQQDKGDGWKTKSSTGFNADVKVRSSWVFWVIILLISPVQCF